MDRTLEEQVCQLACLWWEVRGTRQHEQGGNQWRLGKTYRGIVFQTSDLTRWGENGILNPFTVSYILNVEVCGLTRLTPIVDTSHSQLRWTGVPFRLYSQLVSSVTLFDSNTTLIRWMNQWSNEWMSFSWNTYNKYTQRRYIIDLQFALCFDWVWRLLKWKHKWQKVLFSVFLPQQLTAFFNTIKHVVLFNSICLTSFQKYFHFKASIVSSLSVASICRIFF